MIRVLKYATIMIAIVGIAASMESIVSLRFNLTLAERTASIVDASLKNILYGSIADAR